MISLGAILPNQFWKNVPKLLPTTRRVKHIKRVQRFLVSQTSIVLKCLTLTQSVLENALKENYVPKNDLYLCFGANEEVYGDSQLNIVYEMKKQGIKPALVFDEGISKKQRPGSAGSHGVGKKVPFIISTCNTVFYATKNKYKENDIIQSDLLVQGKTALINWTDENGVLKCPEGWYGKENLYAKSPLDKNLNYSTTARTSAIFTML